MNNFACLEKREIVVAKAYPKRESTIKVLSCNPLTLKTISLYSVIYTLLKLNSILWTKKMLKSKENK